MTDAPDPDPQPRKSPPGEPGPPHTLASWEALLSANTLDILRQLAGSKTIIGVVILLVNNLLLKESPIAETMGDELAGFFNQALDVIGSALAIWGRLTAKGPLIQNKPS